MTKQEGDRWLPLGPHDKILLRPSTRDELMIEPEPTALKPTPEWIMELNADLPAELPAEIVDELESFLLRAKKEFEHVTDLTEAYCHKLAIEHYMNNFVPNLILHRNTPFLSYDLDSPAAKQSTKSKYQPSNKLQLLTWRQFFAEIDQTLAECGLSMKEWGDLAQNTIEGDEPMDPNIYFLPVFIELRKKGFKTYPDLSQ